MFELPSQNPLTVQVGQLLDLECSLQTRGVAVASPHHQEGLLGVQLSGQLGYSGVLIQNFLTKNILDLSINENMRITTWIFVGKSLRPAIISLLRGWKKNI